MASGPYPKRRRVAMLLPNNMAVRNTLETPVLTELAASNDLEICFLTPSADHVAKIKSTGRDGFSWRDIGNPMGSRLAVTSGPASVVLRRLIERALMKSFRKWVGWGNLVFRFNELEGFLGHKNKKNMPPERREREDLAGNYPDPRYGSPFPRSRALYKSLFKIYHTTWYSEPTVEKFIEEYEPVLLVIYNVQNQAIRPWVSVARRRRLKILGIVGSWDQPTSKGPLPPDVDSFMVQSQIMKESLVKHHGVDSRQIVVTGWPQMDDYKRKNTIYDRKDLLERLGIASQNGYMLYGANTPRLGPHEPQIARHLAAKMRKGIYSKDINLVIRPHPKDDLWQERFSELQDNPSVVVLPPEGGNLAYLASQIYHAAIVLASSGSILLDSIALDTCAINIAFDADMKLTYYESIKRWTEIDHFRSVIDFGGVNVVNDFNELDEAIVSYLTNPQKDSEGRRLCRQKHLEPLDGLSSRRLAQAICAAVP